ncbi:hypothetical protein LQ948_13705 [Jiella sp. MQZ9-1]|uniref:Uncharacterized protein n=1 Tax=Jiella flava TaxID=2816857 RepID=A0A939JV05_9HYPH|nr:hypothetical protein [Jiella flava]MBO0663695.1 hypothetical protein [Jiella flava]MCD2472268.1 hypothetical protein [Jiella flava]
MANIESAGFGAMISTGMMNRLMTSWTRPASFSLPALTREMSATICADSGRGTDRSIKVSA